MTNWEGLSLKSIEELLQIFEDRVEPDCIYALEAIVLRLRKDLLEKCEVMCRAYGHSVTVAETIAERTFNSYSKRGKFRLGKSKAATVEAAFKIYLYGIARRELTNFYRELTKKTGYDGNEEIVTELPPLPSNASEEQKIIYNIIESLPYSHKVVYLTYKSHEVEGYNIPKKLQEKIRKHLGDIAQVTIRGYKKEANDRVNQAIDIFKKSKILGHERA